MKRIFTALVALMSGLPAFATPPDAISIHDRIFGVSATHVFILREMSDNLGLHIYGMHDTYLVSKSIETGLDQDIWPVLRVHRGYNSTGEVSILQHFPLNGAVNPFHLLAEANALPITREMRHPDHKYVPEIWLKPDVLQIEENALPLDEVFAQMQVSIDLTSGAVQPYPDGGYQSMTFHTPQELMAEIVLGYEWCELDAALSVRATYDLPKLHLARLHCIHEETVQGASLIVFIPQPETGN